MTSICSYFFRYNLLLVFPAFALILAGCGGGPPETVTVRLVDRFQPTLVSDSPQQTRQTGPLSLWEFSSPATAAGGPESPQTLGWKAGIGVSGLAVREGRLSGRSTTDFPIVYVKRTEGLEQDDLIHSVEIRMRASRGANLSVNGQGDTELNFEQIVGRARGLGWADRTPLLAGDTVQTYTIRVNSPVRASELHHLLVRPTDEPDADFAIESVRIVSRKEHLARIPSGIGWQGLAEIYRDTVVSRSPENIRYELDLPENPWLDLQIGTVEDGPVTFQVRLAPEGDDSGAKPPLLERTVTTPFRWENVPIDLSAHAGRRVSLVLSLSADEPGMLGFWGNPTIRSRQRIAPAARAGAAPALPGAADSDPPQGVILIMTDTLRKDHLSFYGYSRDTTPQLARMAAGGVFFKDNIAQATWTKVSTPSLLTSLYPTSHRVKEFADRLPAAATTLAEVFRDAGYATVSYSSVLFTGKFTNLHQGFEELHESTSVADRESSKTAREYVDRLGDWLELHQDVPFFAFLHVFDPHDPYEPYRPYNGLYADLSRKKEHEENLKKVREVIQDPLMKQFGMPSRQELEKAGIDPDQYVAYDIDWYDGSIRALDAEISRLVERLRSLGLDERTLIVFVSDHGEEFLDHGRMFHGQTVYGELTDVPLVFYAPGLVPEGVAVEETVENVDVLPTILELCRLPAPDGIAGRSLLPLMAVPTETASSGLFNRWTLRSFAQPAAWSPRPAISEKARTVHMGGPPPRDTESYAIILDGWKLIHNVIPEQGKPEFELYHHAEDPLNQHDLASAEPERVRQLAAELDQWREAALAAQLPEADSTEGLSQEELERLRSLGYIQ